MAVKANIGKPDAEKWKMLSEKSPFRSFFQTEACFDMYERSGCVEPFAVYVEERGELQGVVVGYVERDGSRLTRYLSRRAIIQGGALIGENASEEAVRVLYEEVGRVLCEKAIYIEFRNYHDYSRYRSAIEMAGFEYEDHLNLQVRTEDEGRMMSNVVDNKRREIKNGLLEGALIDENPTEEDVRQWYVLLRTLYRNRVRTPLLPYRFFEQGLRTDGVHYLMVKKNGNVIGGVMSAGESGTLYEWYECGISEGSVNGSVLATYAGMRYACKNGFSTFDMMGAGRRGKEYGVRRFKARFGGEEVEFGRFRKRCSPLLYAIGSLGVWFLKTVRVF